MANSLPTDRSQPHQPRDGILSAGTLRPIVSCILAAVIVLAVYVWFVSVGYWTWWPKTTYTYDLLGSAFRAGQVSLQETPDPALLALPDPYDPAARTGLQYPWDASLYNGRFYLYWGPTPGFILGLLKLLYSGQIADQYLVFAFVAGAYVWSTLVLLKVWRRFFSHTVPAAILFVTFVALGLVGTATWLLNRPAGYEVAIAGGQFFLIAGLYFALAALLDGSASKGKLALAGASWALAIGSRISTVLPVAVLALVIVLCIWHRHRNGAPVIAAVAALALPLALGAAALSWYNWARFGSVFEFGQRYQLTLVNLRASYDQAFSIEYVPANLHNYLFNPVGLERTFPFLTPVIPQRLPPGPSLAVPAAQVEPVTGLLISAPFLLYALLPLAALRATGDSHRTAENAANPGATEGSPQWLYAGLFMSAALSFMFLLLYFYPTERQLDDVVPFLALLAVLGTWEGWRLLRRHPGGLTIYGMVTIGSILASIVVSCLLAVTSYDNRFQHLNRQLLRNLIQFFGR